MSTTPHSMAYVELNKYSSSSGVEIEGRIGWKERRGFTATYLRGTTGSGKICSGIVLRNVVIESPTTLFRGHLGLFLVIPRDLQVMSLAFDDPRFRFFS